MPSIHLSAVNFPHLNMMYGSLDKEAALGRNSDVEPRSIFINYFLHIFICWFALIFWTECFGSSTNKLSVHSWQRPFCPANDHPDVRRDAANGEWVAAEWRPNQRRGKGEHTCATGRSMEPSRLFQRLKSCWLDSCALLTTYHQGPRFYVQCQSMKGVTKERVGVMWYSIKD